MPLAIERIEEAFRDEYDALVRAGVEAMLTQSLGAVLWDVYRRGYLRGHSERSREVQQEARSTANLPVSVTYEDGRLTIGGRDVVPER